jgi:hypothetical protein
MDGEYCQCAVVEIVLPPLVALAVLTVVGLVGLYFVGQRARQWLVPAAPAIGLAVTVCALHWISLVAPMSIGAPVWIGVVAAVATWVGRRHAWWRPGRVAGLWLALGVVGGAIVGAAALGPSWVVRDARVVQATDNNDAIWFVSTAEWLVHHRAMDAPTLVTDRTRGPRSGSIAVTAGSSDSPIFNSAEISIDTGSRLGESLVEAAASGLSRRSVMSLWYPLTATWLMLIPGAAIGAASVLRLRRGTGLVGGVLAAGAAISVSQVYSQHSAALAGMALALVCFAVIVELLVSEEPVMSAWFAGLVGVALVSTYSELAVVLAPALLIVALWEMRRSATRPRVLRRVLIMVAGAVVAAPLGVWNALVYAGHLNAKGGPVAFPSAFANVPFGIVVNRYLGLTPLHGTRHLGVATVAVGALAVAGVVLALWRSPLRVAWAAVLASWGWVLWSLSRNGDGYSQQRAVEFMVPLVVLVIVAGFDAVLPTRGSVPRPSPPSSRSGWPGWPGWSAGGRATPAAVPAVVAVVVLAVLAVNLRTATRSLERSTIRARHVTSSFAEPARWLDELDGGDASVSVVVGDFFEQNWLLYELRDHPDVGWPMLYPDYTYTDAHWTGELERYVLASRSGFLWAAPEVIVDSNDRFVLLDRQRGPFGVVAPATGWNALEQLDGGPAQWMADDGTLLVVSNAQQGAGFTVTASGLAQLVPLSVSVTGELAQGNRSSFTVDAVPSEVTIAVSDGFSRLEFHNAPRAALPKGSPDHRLLSLLVSDVRWQFG